MPVYGHFRRRRYSARASARVGAVSVVFSAFFPVPAAFGGGHWEKPEGAALPFNPA
jgi:hypothetical protein